MTDMTEQLLALNKMSKKSVALYHKFALSVEISDSALGVLYALVGTEGCSQYDLCTKWAIPKQTINTAVGALQKRGLVTLSAAFGTRNKKTIVLTDVGRVFAEKTVGQLRNAEFCALAELTAEEREVYIRLNRKYNQALTEKLDDLLDSVAQISLPQC